MWIAKEVEVFADYVTYVLARTQAGTELTHIMIARSRKQLEHSRAILSNAADLKFPQCSPRVRSDAKSRPEQ